MLYSEFVAGDPGQRKTKTMDLHTRLRLENQVSRLIVVKRGRPTGASKRLHAKVCEAYVTNRETMSKISALRAALTDNGVEPVA